MPWPANLCPSGQLAGAATLCRLLFHPAHRPPKLPTHLSVAGVETTCPVRCRFLFQKVLSASDAATSVGRVILPRCAGVVAAGTPGGRQRAAVLAGGGQSAGTWAACTRLGLGAAQSRVRRALLCLAVQTWVGRKERRLYLEGTQALPPLAGVKPPAHYSRLSSGAAPDRRLSLSPAHPQPCLGAAPRPDSCPPTPPQPPTCQSATGRRAQQWTCRTPGVRLCTEFGYWVGVRCEG